MKIYISGKITGDDNALEKFENAAEKIKAIYPSAEIINPFDVSPICEGKRWINYMIDDIKALDECTHIYLLKDWRESKGARIEQNFAYEQGIEIIHESNLVFDVNECIAKIEQISGRTIESIRGKSRRNYSYIPRQVISYLLYVYTNLITQEIGDMVGQNHATALHGHKRVEIMLSTNDSLISDYKEYIDQVKKLYKRQR